MKKAKCRTCGTRLSLQGLCEKCEWTLDSDSTQFDIWMERHPLAAGAAVLALFLFTAFVAYIMYYYDW